MKMLRWTMMLAAIALTAGAKRAHAQCTDPWITQAIRELKGRAPNGSAGTGECAINRYGGGSLGDYTSLKKLVQGSFYCSDPWIGEAVLTLYNRAPVGSSTVGECNDKLYTGYWTSYPDLKTKVQSALSAMSSASMRFDAAGAMITSAGTVPVSSINYLLANRIKNPVAGGGASIIAGTGNIVAGGGGNIIAANVYTIQSGAVTLGNGTKFWSK